MIFTVEEEPLEVKQANEKYLLEQKHELEKCYENLKNKSLPLCIFIKDTLKLKLNEPLYFSFGKYKGRIVQNILEEDEPYCEWFIDNIRGTDFNTLKIIDFIYKKVNGKEYWLKNPKIELDNLIKEFEINLSDTEKQSILDDFSYTKKRSYVGNSPDYNCRYMSDWEEQMYEIYDYGDFC